MPRYFFDIDDSVDVRDDTGQDFPNNEAAKSEAFNRAAEYGADPTKLKSSGVIVVTVRDGPESVVFRVRLVCQIEVH